MNVYVSGGAGRESVRDPQLGRLTKKMLMRLFPQLNMQAHPNQSTQIVVIPNGVGNASRTTRNKAPGARIMTWSQFKSRYFMKRAGGNARDIQRSMAEERSLSQGTGRTWRLRRGQQLLRTANEKRGAKTRGWSLDFPLRGKERQELYAKCGSKCFLGPNLSFPICKRCYGGNCRGCAIDPRGVQAAYQRARQYGHTQIAAKADALRSHLRP